MKKQIDEIRNDVINAVDKDQYEEVDRLERKVAKFRQMLDEALKEKREIEHQLDVIEGENRDLKRRIIDPEAREQRVNDDVGNGPSGEERSREPYSEHLPVQSANPDGREEGPKDGEVRSREVGVPTQPRGNPERRKGCGLFLILQETNGKKSLIRPKR